MNKSQEEFRKGDKVRLVKGGLCGNETQPWWKIAGLKIGKTYTVRRVVGSKGWIRIEGSMFGHCPLHFEPVNKKFKVIEKNYSI